MKGAVDFVVSSGSVWLGTGQSWQQNVTGRREADPGKLQGDDQKKK